MKKINCIIFSSLIIFFSLGIEASVLEDLKEDIRPTVTRFLGEKISLFLLGTSEGEVRLPLLPETKKIDAKSLEGLYSKEKKKIHYSKKVARKYDYYYLKEIIRSVRQSDPTDEEVAKWMNVLSQKGSREGVYSALVLDKNYLNLERTSRFPTKEVLNFTPHFLKKYANKIVTKKNLEEANFFTVKKEIVERILRVVDELFRLPGDDIYNWYGVFSADLAQHFPKVMNNKVRKITDASVHRDWGKSVPDQYLKSEILIKLHKVFNSLQGEP